MNLETARGQVAYDLTMEYVKEMNMFNTTSRTVEETVRQIDEVYTKIYAALDDTNIIKQLHRGIFNLFNNTAEKAASF